MAELGRLIDADTFFEYYHEFLAKSLRIIENLEYLCSVV